MGGPNARLARGGYVRPDVHSSTVPDFADDAAFGSGGFHPGLALPLDLPYAAGGAVPLHPLIIPITLGGDDGEAPLCRWTRLGGGRVPREGDQAHQLGYQHQRHEQASEEQLHGATWCALVSSPPGFWLEAKAGKHTAMKPTMNSG